jgi:hypothetical protein
MDNSSGFYNKYIYTNNSYLSLHIIRQTIKNYGTCKNINDHIDAALSNNYYKQNLKIIKEKVQNKKYLRTIKEKNIHLRIIKEKVKNKIKL